MSERIIIGVPEEASIGDIAQAVYGSELLNQRQKERILIQLAAMTVAMALEDTIAECDCEVCRGVAH